MTTIGRGAAGSAAQRGFTLLEMSIVLIIAGLLSAAAAMGLRYLSDRNTTTNLAYGLERIYNGAHAYVSQNYNALSTSDEPEVAGFAAPMTPTVAELRAAHFLSHADSPDGYTGGHWQVRITPEDPLRCPGPACDLQLLVYLDKPVTRDGHAALNLAAAAALEAKVPAGFSGLGPYRGSLTGVQGSWTVANPVPDRAAVLGARGSFAAKAYSIYLLRNGELPMQGDLNMTDEKGQAHSITGLDAIEAEGKIHTSGQIKADEGVVSLGPIYSREDIYSEGSVDAGKDVTARNLLIPGKVVKGSDEPCKIGGSIARDTNGTVYVCAPVPGQPAAHQWNPVRPPSGTLCGFGTVEGNAFMSLTLGSRGHCKGRNPAVSCPAGYTRTQFYNGTAMTDIFVCVAQ